MFFVLHPKPLLNDAVDGRLFVRQLVACLQFDCWVVYCYSYYVFVVCPLFVSRYVLVVCPLFVCNLSVIGFSGFCLLFVRCLSIVCILFVCFLLFFVYCLSFVCLQTFLFFICRSSHMPRKIISSFDAEINVA
jgi:hypothetical protein